MRGRRARATIAGALLAAALGTGASDWRDQQEIWWSVPKIKREVVVALLVARQLAEVNRDDERLSRINEALEHSLLLFDVDKSDSALQELATLSYFNLGAAPGEIFSCVVTRKGGTMLPQLQKAIEETDDPCVRELGSSDPICASAVNPAAAKDRIKSLIVRIKAATPCAIER